MYAYEYVSNAYWCMYGCMGIVQDAVLAAHVQERGEGGWAEVAARLGGRTGIQCHKRWNEVLNPGIKRSAWSAEEVCACVCAMPMYVCVCVCHACVRSTDSTDRISMDILYACTSTYMSS